MKTDRNERVERLRVAAQTRSAETAARARRAMITLHARGHVVDYAAVAAEADVSVSYLKKNPAMRAEIKRLRGERSSGEVRRRDEIGATESSLRTRLDVANDRVAELDAEVKRLRSENETLLGEVLALRRRARRSQ